MEQVTVFIPASIANMGCGFDIMGMAVESAGDILSMEMSEGDGIEIINRTDYDIPSTVEDNVMTPSIRAMLNAAGVKKNIKITLMCKIMPGSGIGSSAASAAGAVVALNHLLGNRFSEKEMVEFAMEGEALSSGGAKHADNVAPAILGGIVLICSYHPFEYIRIPFPETFCAAIAHPRITVKTSESRAVLPKDIPLHDAILQWANVGGLVAGFMNKDMGLVGRSMRDVIVEPHRKRFIPGFDELRGKLAAAGATAFNISGSGPSVFALCDDENKAKELCKIMSDHFENLGIEADSLVAHGDNRGARVIF
ncbi:MAG: homoserine kinase [Bacteroidales bacterium]|nr:homoserine kinase [Bacteroidales bacterium]